MLFSADMLVAFLKDAIESGFYRSAGTRGMVLGRYGYKPLEKCTEAQHKYRASEGWRLVALKGKSLIWSEETRC